MSADKAYERESGRPLVVLAGPTAVGKTRLSIALAKALNGEIVSADSMQVYRYMDIGSAKISREEMQGIPHHMIDILDPWEPFNVVVFQQKCRECIREIHGRGGIPILTGGTGFYIQAVLKEIDFTDNREDPACRAELERLADERGTEYLHSLLAQVDSASAEAIHANNRKRVIRALEFYRLTGTPISAHNSEERKKRSAFRSCYFVLNDDRERLYDRIDARVDEMLAQGLAEEVKRLRQMGCTRDMVSMQGLGYKELLAWLDGEISYEAAVALIKQNTRHFAKRQLTWFRREPEVIWVDKREFGSDEEKILAFLTDQLKETGITVP